MLFIVAALGATALPCAGAHASACARLDWQLTNPAPFSSADLAEAIRIRCPRADGKTVPVAVRWAAAGVIAAEAAGRHRQVSLGEESGVAAARLVAIAVLDVVRPLPGEAEPTTLTGTLPPAEPADRARLVLALGFGLGRGGTSAGFAVEPALSLEFGFGSRPGPRLGVHGELGYFEGRGRVSGKTFTLRMLPARVGPTVTLDRFAFSAGALLRPYFTSGWDGGRGWQWGGYAAASMHLPLRGSFGVRVALGLDLPADVLDFRVLGSTLLETGRLVPWVRVGGSWRVL
jgi:hypothetical protein